MEIKIAPDQKEISVLVMYEEKPPAEIVSCRISARGAKGGRMVGFSQDRFEPPSNESPDESPDEFQLWEAEPFVSGYFPPGDYFLIVTCGSDHKTARFQIV